MNARVTHNVADTRVVVHWIVICAVIPMLVVLPHLTARIPLEVVLPLITIVYSGTRLARIASTGANRIVELTFWLYVYVFFGLSAFLQTAVGHFPWGGSYSFALIAKANVLIWVGMVAFDVGYRTHLRKVHSIGLAKFTHRLVTRHHLFAMLIVGLALSLYATLKLGGLEQLFLNRAQRIQLTSSNYDTAFLTMYNAAAKTIPYVLLIALVAYRTRERKKRLIFTILILAVGLWALIENNPIATARFQVGTLILGVYFVIPWRRTRVRFAIYALIVGLVVVFPYADLFRATNSADLAVRIQKYERHPPLIDKVDYDSFQQVANGIRMVDKWGFEDGHQILGAALFWVPRSVWENKAEPTGVLIAQLSGYAFTNLSAPLWIEFYVDGGWIWTIIGFLIYGFLVRRLDQIREQANNRSTSGYIFATVFAGYQIFLLRGSLMPAIAYLSPVIPLVLLCTGSVVQARKRAVEKEQSIVT